MKILIFSMLALMLTVAPVCADDLQEGEDAYEQGDYKTAFEKLKPLAEQGYAGVQFNLGVMYANGRGVTQDYKEAVKWYRLSAEQGFASAQYNLGLMYDNGQGVTQDYVLTHMWSNIAGANGHEKARELRDLVEKTMTPAQITEAQKLAREWMEKHNK